MTSGENAMETRDSLVFMPLTSWRGPVDAEDQNSALDALEAGKVLVLPRLSFPFEPPERRLLAAATGAERRKNISFDPEARTIANAADPSDSALLKAMMERFSRSALSFVNDLLPSYAPHLSLGRTSFRPAEIEGRVAAPRHDDRRLHVDAFPSRPVQGRRILRVFTNVADDGAARRWRVGEPFADFAQKFTPRVKSPWPGAPAALRLLGITKSRRSAYDHYMLALHDLAKLDDAYQASAPKIDVDFAPGTTWLCFTDQVLHAALSGHAALEQTFYLPVEAMRAPSTAPLRVLEALAGRALT